MGYKEEVLKGWRHLFKQYRFKGVDEETAYRRIALYYFTQPETVKERLNSKESTRAKGSPVFTDAYDSLNRYIDWALQGMPLTLELIAYRVNAYLRYEGFSFEIPPSQILRHFERCGEEGRPLVRQICDNPFLYVKAGVQNEDR